MDLCTPPQHPSPLVFSLNSILDAEPVTPYFVSQHMFWSDKLVIIKFVKCNYVIDVIDILAVDTSLTKWYASGIFSLFPIIWREKENKYRNFLYWLIICHPFLRINHFSDWWQSGVGLQLTRVGEMWPLFFVTILTRIKTNPVGLI